jgi:hypothetical protein
VVADFQFILFGQFVVHYATRPILLPGFKLVRWDVEVGKHLKQFLRIGAKLREEILRLVVLILPAKPGFVDHLLYPGNRADSLAIGDGQKLAQRNFVAHNQPLRRFRAAIGQVKRPPNGHHHRQQQQGKADAQQRQDTAALVAEGIFPDKADQRHD